jgi:hypothetical protein
METEVNGPTKLVPEFIGIFKRRKIPDITAYFPQVQMVI